MNRELIYTDGACRGNGTKNATGGFGMFIAKTSLFKEPIKISKGGFTMSSCLDGCDNVECSYPVTNIRMEGLAIVSTLALYADTLVKNISNDEPVERLNNMNVFDLKDLKPRYGHTELKESESLPATIEIVTDSLFWMNVIQKWIAGWVAKDMLFKKKNPDILLLLIYYTEILKQNDITVIYTHVKSHQKGKRSLHADGNDVADILATSAASVKFCAM